jgi:N6-adenosine-specific RNA methylase IME4/ParB-like chromosome segregation protein Spo0J
MGVPIEEVKIGERHRRDLGDVGALARSIAEVGLLHPIVINGDRTLIAGERRVAACRALGWREIAATVVNLDETVRGEFAENAIRKDFTPSEIDAIRREVEPLERAAAKRRQGARTDLHPGKLPGCPGNARDKIAAFAGRSGRTVEKIARVVEAAVREPERFGALVDEMDRTGKVDAPYRKLRQKEDERRVEALRPAAGRYRTLVIDPPWEYRQWPSGHRHPGYATLGQGELAALPVASWAEDDCHLYLWTTNAHMPEACQLLARWGFLHKTILTWVKPRIGLGAYFRGSTEHVLFGVRGALNTRAHDIPTHFEAPVGAHSEKPEAFYEIVRRASYLPAGEAFGRAPRPGFVDLFSTAGADPMAVSA